MGHEIMGKERQWFWPGNWVPQAEGDNGFLSERKKQ